MTEQQLSEAPTERKLTLAEHLEELRRRLGICLLALVAAVAISATQVERLIQWISKPAEPYLFHFAYFTPTEPLLAYLKVSLLAGLILAMPVFLAQVWGFVRPGLTPSERRLGGWFIGWGSAQFAAGAAFAYFLVLPLALRMLLGIGSSFLEPVISIDRYLSFALGLLGWCGVSFELPVVLYLLARMNIVTSEWLRQQRSYAILVLVIAAALLTPTTDPISLLLTSAPMWALYELSILLTRVAIRRRP